MTYQHFSAALALLLATAAPAQHKHQPISQISDLKSQTPAAQAPSLLSLDVYATQDALHLLTARATSPNALLLYQQSATRGAEGWTSPVLLGLDQAPPHARGRGTDFQIAAHGSRRIAVWLAQGSGFGGRGPLVAALSDDGGRAWSALPTPADDGGDGDHAFIDLAATPDGSIHAVWLDDRHGQPKGLRSATLPAGEDRWLSNQTIDPETCECCWNTLKSDSSGLLYVLYRDIEPRDMALATSVDNGQSWTRAGPVGAFGWDFDGCPHAGGGLAIDETGPAPILHALVWTGRPGKTGLHYLNAPVDTLAWSYPKPIGSPAAKHADIAIDVTGRIHIAWTELSPSGTVLKAATSTNRGQGWSHSQTIPANAPSHPRLAADRDAVRLLWTESGNPTPQQRLIAPNSHSRPILLPKDLD